MKILINLIGGQNAPNFIACRYYNPDKIFNVSTNTTVSQSRFLKESFSPDKFGNDVVIFDPYDIYEVSEKINSIITNYYISNEIILNFTGATKPMSISSFNVSNSKNIKCIYIDSQFNRILEYYENKKLEKKIDCKITIDEHFKMYGHSIKPPSASKPRQDANERIRLKDYLKENYSIAKNLIEIFAEKYNSNKDFFKIDNEVFDSNHNSAFWVKNEKKLLINIEKNEFYLLGSEPHKYFTGLWFENLVSEKFNELNIFDETLFNSTIQDDSGKIPEAEFDVIAVKNHKLYIFECKSGVLLRDYIYKLASLKNFLSNIYAGIYFITFEDLNNNKFNSVLNAFNIKIMSYKNLETSLNNIIK